MALSRFGVSPSLESAEFAYCGSLNLSTRLSRPSPMQLIGRYSNSALRKCTGVKCALSRNDVIAPLESEGSAQSALSVSTEEESGHVVRFKISDFKILDSVSIGLGGRVQGN